MADSGTTKDTLTADELQALAYQYFANLKAAEPAAPEMPAAPAMIRIDAIGSYSDLRKDIAFLQLGVDALLGIGEMMEPNSIAGDEQLNGSHRRDPAAVFRFFGEALKRPVSDAYDVVDSFAFRAFVRAET